MNNLSYCLIGDPLAAVQPLGPAAPNLSGLWLWSKTFREYGKDGQVKIIWNKEDLEKFDVIHINYTPSNLQLPTLIRDALGDDSDTKLVINVDLDISYHGINWAHYSHFMIKELNMADCVFHVEKHGASYLSNLLDYKVYTLSHPVDVKRLYDYVQEDRHPFAACVYHRYHPDTLTPYNVFKKFKIDKHLYNASGEYKKFIASQGCWDLIVPTEPPLDYINKINKATIGCDLYRGYTFGRSIVEFAALGIPSICSNTVEASNILFPDTSVNPLGITKAKETVHNILHNQEFANNVITYAHDHCGWYGLNTRYNEFIKMIEDIS